MITVFGSVNLDLIGRVGHLPRPGETVLGGAFVTAPGGKGANQALAAARAGARVRMVSAVGADANAAEALALLRAGGVDVAAVEISEQPTGVALILVDDAGENVIAVLPGANGSVGEEAVAKLAFEPGDVLLMQLEVPTAGIVAAARRARDAGCPVLLNFAPFRADALGLLDHITHLIVNETECALIAAALGHANAETEHQIEILAARYHRLKIIETLGRRGATAAGLDSDAFARALPVEAIDTVGAGDTFCGYLAAGLAEGKILSEAMRLAAFAGSLACTKAGAQPAIPMRDAVNAALKQWSILGEPS